VIGAGASSILPDCVRSTSPSRDTGYDLILGDVYSEATAISADGQTIAGFAFNGSLPRILGPFRWTAADGIVAFPFNDGTETARPTAISADGSTVVVGSWLWTPSGLQDIGFVGKALSADGTVVVGGAEIWDAAHGARNLQQVLTDDHGLDLMGWTLSDAVGISADGLTIAGNGVNPSGQSEAWLVVVPEPGTGVLVMMGLASVAASRRGRDGSRIAIQIGS